MNNFQTRAFELLTGPATQQAFQIHREPAASATLTAATFTVRVCYWRDGSLKRGHG